MIVTASPKKLIQITSGENLIMSRVSFIGGFNFIKKLVIIVITGTCPLKTVVAAYRKTVFLEN
jgi:hypothetical protein